MVHTHLLRRAVSSEAEQIESKLESQLQPQSGFPNGVAASKYSDDVKEVSEDELSHRLFPQSNVSSIESKTYKSLRHSINRNTLNEEKDGEERLSAVRAASLNGAIDAATPSSSYSSSSSLIFPSSDLVSHYENPLEVNALWYNAGVSYFPDQVARVNYIASVVKPDTEGDYLRDLQGGMDLLATRLAPKYFPGTIVRGITTQIDGYFPAPCPSEAFKNCQDVTASIGIYLNALPNALAGTVNIDDSDSDNNKNSKDAASNIVVDPSTMTEELIAFQESLEEAIANNELQDAIREDYRQKHNSDSNNNGNGQDIDANNTDNYPSVVIVTVTTETNPFTPPITESGENSGSAGDIGNAVNSNSANDGNININIGVDIDDYSDTNSDTDNEVVTEIETVTDNERDECDDLKINNGCSGTESNIDNQIETETVIDNEKDTGNAINNVNSSINASSGSNSDNQIETHTESVVDNANKDENDGSNSVGVESNSDSKTETETEFVIDENNDGNDNANNDNIINSFIGEDGDNETDMVEGTETVDNDNKNNDIGVDVDVDIDDETDTETETNTGDGGSLLNTEELTSSPGFTDTTSIVVDKPFAPTSSIAAEATSEDSTKPAMSTGGIVGTVAVILLLVSVVTILVVVRKKSRKRNSDREGKRNTRKKQNGGKKRCADDDDRQSNADFGQAQENLLGNVYSSSSDDDGDEEDGFTGRTVRTAASGSTNTTATSHDLRTIVGDEMLVPIVATSSSGLSLGTETTTSSSCASPNRNIRNNAHNITPILEYDYEEEGKAVDNLVSQAVVVSDDLITFDQALNNVRNELNSSNNNDDDDEDNDFIVDEDACSNSSVGQQLLNASRSSELCIAASTSTDLIAQPTKTTAVVEPVPAVEPARLAPPDLIVSSETIKETIDPSNNTLRSLGDISSPRKVPFPTSMSSRSMSSDGGSSVGVDSVRPLNELDIAIQNGDWAAVGATAASMATSAAATQAPQTQRNRQISSASSVASSDFSQKTDELDRLIDAGDWQAVVVAAARYDAEGESTVGGESRSCRSRASTQGSDAMDSYVSNMDYSSVDRSANMSRSVTTSASQKERIQEIRAQVTQMVQDTVPDEVDNVDEMMNQFKGKEEELLETLRTMKERNVAKKARLESQKIARRNTRSRDKKEAFPSSAPGRTKSLTPSAIDQLEIVPSGINNNDNVPIPPCSSSITTDNDEETGYYSEKEYGSFENATKIDPDSAAAAAAAWAIQRSLDNMMEKEEKELR